MKRSQQYIFNLSSRTPKTIGVQYVTWHAILTTTTHSHFTAHAGQSFLNLQVGESHPTTHTWHTWVTLNTHEQCCAQAQDGHSPDSQTHALLAPTATALHASLTCLAACTTNAGPNALVLNVPSLEEGAVWRDAPVTISQLSAQSVKQEESVSGTEDQQAQQEAQKQKAEESGT